jgi:hypothetical protein
MASRPILSPFPAIVNGNMSGNIISAVTIIQNLSMLSYGVSWTGTTPVGTLMVEVSNDYSQYADGTVNNPGTWNTMYFYYNGAIVSSVPITGNTGNGLFDILETAAFAMRLVYTAGSGTGVLQAVLNGKVA